MDITTEELEDGTCRVSYCPTEPGNYIISVKFGDQHVPGGCWGRELGRTGSAARGCWGKRRHWEGVSGRNGGTGGTGRAAWGYWEGVLG